ncbi:hypothetical protein [Acinetobacter bereziniae]|uniref:hypothetical protein n=1 Tax=Acinetobacter bereziniae TaxID=106648 RepID=UPI0012509423|nr:hypothetical protein [Acinetobacter bereziniae]
MIKVESMYATTFEELVKNTDGLINVLRAELKGFRIISVSHSNPNETHPKYSTLIVYEYNP